MTSLLGKLDGHTLLLLTDDESRQIRKTLEWFCAKPSSHETDAARSALRDLNRGIARGTAKLSEEFKAEQARKKAAKK